MKSLILSALLLILSVIKTMAQEPDYKVVFLESYYTEYLNATKKDTSGNYKNLYLEKVRLPIFHKFFIQSEYASFVYEDLARPSLDIPYLKKTVKGITDRKKHQKSTS